MTSPSSRRMRWRDALVLKIQTEHRPPVVSNYWLALKLLQLVCHGSYDGRPLQLPRHSIDGRMLSEARSALIDRGILRYDRSLPKTLLRFPDQMGRDVAESMCAIDPFGHMAYLSAMAYYGLSNRLPKVLYFVSPEPRLWGELARERMKKELEDLYPRYIEAGLPHLRHSKVEKIDGVLIEQIRTKASGGWRNANEGALRVSGIGRTFLDMLQRAEFCGGVRHVLEVFEEFGKQHLSAIIAELNLNGTKVDRVRAGYILETYCGIHDPRVDAWTVDASRGGSRKLDPQAEYSSIFSERWSLSLNV